VKYTDDELKQALKHFESMKSDAVAVLDSGFGTKEGESDTLYRRRKLIAEIAICAVNKQIPTKPFPRDLWELGTAQGSSCSNCGYDFPVSYIEPYCCKCGQAIKYHDD